MTGPVTTGSTDGLIKAMPLVFVGIWSTGFVVARYGMPYAPPLSFLAIRFALSFFFFAAWALVSRAKWPTTSAQWAHLAVVGLLLQVGYLGGVWSAVKLGMGAGLSALIVGLQPLLTALWFSLIGATVTRRQWGGLLLGLLGVVLVVLEKVQRSLEVTSDSLAFALMALAAITVGTIYQKRFVVAADVRAANAIQLLVAALIAAPLALLESEPMQWNAALVGAMAWSVLVLTVLGGSLLFMLIQRGAVMTVTSLFYLVPPTTAVLAWLLFDEHLTWIIGLGVILTATGVGLVVKSSAAKSA
jgi:drug/metabolite transporter (DMT)-like permease